MPDPHMCHGKFDHPVKPSARELTTYCRDIEMASLSVTVALGLV